MIMATIMTIKVEKKTITPKYNPYQTGCGIHIPNKEPYTKYQAKCPA